MDFPISYICHCDLVPNVAVPDDKADLITRPFQATHQSQINPRGLGLSLRKANREWGIVSGG